ncbi:HEXXH motif-containing putative peptide modification protein [Streptomyces sp. NPDC056291]|uniref:aKG-HExxH-type peptide beta-hydroxylase n=1 Tax=Streptomyces sp. NPDC056291 TaxID=3345772 RepID=UPI0035DCEF49
MNSIAAALHLDAITAHQHERTVAVRTVLQPGHTLAPDEALPLSYALAHHQLEGAETAARRHDQAAMDWHRSAGPALASLAIGTRLGPRIVVAPNEGDLIHGPHSDTPYYVLGPATIPAAEPLGELTDSAFAHITDAGLHGLVRAHAAVICLTGERRPEQVLRSFAITRLPATVFTDHTGDPAILGRDLVHEAAHNWLNGALTALQLTVPDTETYFSPWRGTMRPAFGFLHACFAFPLTVIYAARVLPTATGAGRTVLADHLRQQRPQLEHARKDFDQALTLIAHDELRERLRIVFQHACSLGSA